MYRWASNDEVERQAAVKHWKRAIEIAVELGVDTMNSEFGRGPHPDKGSCYCCHTGSMIEACEDAWWRSMEELVPVFEKEGIKLHIEPHPEDWCETLQPAVDIIRTVNSKNVKFLYCAPHTFYFGDDTEAMLREAPTCWRMSMSATPSTTRPPRACATSSTRRAPRPACTSTSTSARARCRWDDFFGTLAEVGFDGIMTACVFAWEDKADESGTLHARRDAALRRQVLGRLALAERPALACAATT